MPSDSTGVYSLVSSYFVQAGDTLLPVQYNPVVEDIAAGLTARLMADGRKVMTGNLQMGANRITGAGAGRGNDDVATIRQVGRKAAFDTVADLLADNSVGYASATVIVSPGDIIEAQGFRYEVVADDATGADLVETAGGVKCRVLPLAGMYFADAFGLITDGTGDNSTILEQIRAFLRMQSTAERRPAISFTSDTTIAASVWPNFAIYNALIFGNGVTFRNTGTGNCVILDATTQPGYSGQAYNTKIVDFFVEGGPTSGHGVYSKGAHHAYVQGEVRGCGTNRSALEVDGAVLSTFAVVTSVNRRNPFYEDGKPLRGMNLTECYACEFPMVIVEGVGAQGVRLNSGAFNNFRFGSSEGNTGTNIEFGEDTIGNMVWGLDFEVPANNQGIIDRGRWNAWFNVTDDRLLAITSTAIGAKVFGGSFQSISDSGRGSRFRDITYGANDGTYTALSNAIGTYRMTDPYNVSGGGVFEASVRRRERFGTGAIKIAEDARNVTVGSAGTPPSVPGSVAYASVSFPGVQVNDIVQVGIPAGLTDNYIIRAKCMTANEVRVTITQVAGTAANPLPSGANLRLSYSRWEGV